MKAIHVTESPEEEDPRQTFVQQVISSRQGSEPTLDEFLRSMFVDNPAPPMQLIGQ